MVFRCQFGYNIYFCATNRYHNGTIGEICYLYIEIIDLKLYKIITTGQKNNQVPIELSKFCLLQIIYLILPKFIFQHICIYMKFFR